MIVACQKERGASLFLGRDRPVWFGARMGGKVTLIRGAAADPTKSSYPPPITVRSRLNLTSRRAKQTIGNPGGVGRKVRERKVFAQSITGGKGWAAND